MKVAISCDKIIGRDYTARVIEAFIEIFPEAEIFTLSHVQGSVIGPIEQRKIHSSYLSHLVKKQEDFWKYSFLIPSAAEKLFISCSFDLIINISTGLSQGIKRCEQTKQITYFLNDELEDRRDGSLYERTFRSYLKNWSRKSIEKNVDQLWSTKDLKPFINISDYPLFPANVLDSFPMDTYLLEAEGLSLESAKEWIRALSEQSIKFKFVGKDFHLSELKSSLGEDDFFGDRCSGELAPILAGSRGYIGSLRITFSERAAACLATGRPILLPKGKKEMEDMFKGPGSFFFEGFDELFCHIDSINEDARAFEPQKIRANAQKFHDVKFKAEVKRRVEKYL